VRLATIITPDGLRLHVRGRDGYVDVAQATGDARLSELAGVLAGGEEALELVRGVSEREGREVAEADFGPAVPSPNRILCLGVNYLEHALEGGRPPTTWPETFVRGSDSVAAPYGDLVKPELSSRFDFEGELGVVIGRGGRYIPAEEAFSAVAGFVVLNDATAREWQRAASQWTPGKNFGEVMQSARTSQMIFDIPRTIEYLSSFTTLRPGDVVATGTPGGVGFARTPPVWLQPGDLIEVTIEGLGRIANRVVAEEVEFSDWPWSPPAAAKATL
jgi:acylpyruvate hydrolase